MAEISRTLTGDPRQIRADYNGKKYAALIKDLQDFETLWLDKANGQKQNHEHAQRPINEPE